MRGVFECLVGGDSRVRLGITGHRPPKIGGYHVPNPIYTRVYTAIRNRIIELRPISGVTGMAQGVDHCVSDTDSK